MGLPVAVVYKFFDDQGVYLAVIITYYAFVAIVPLLLLATSLLGFVLFQDPGLRSRIVDSAIANFPVVGDQLGRPEGLQGSTGAVLIGTLLALYGALGLGTAVQNAFHTAWAVPRNSRPNPFKLRLRSLGLLVAGGLAMALLTAVSTAVQITDSWLGSLGGIRQLLVSSTTIVVMAGIAAVLLREGADRRHSLRQALPGAILISLGWHAVQILSTTLIQHSLRQASSMNQ
ncbi:MAG: YihY/virulence factor BrkB family protein, partial [Marmoricola sp.]